MTTTAAPITSESTVTPALLHQLANTAQVAGWGPDGIDVKWLSEVSDALFQAAWDMGAMVARARLGSADTVDELMGAGR